MDVSSISGEISLNNIQADELKISSTSGAVTIDSVKANTISANMVSSELISWNVATQKLDIDTVSGSAMLFLLSDGCNLDAKTVSGTISDTLGNGGLNLVDVKFRSISGSLNIERDYAYYDN